MHFLMVGLLVLTLGCATSPARLSSTSQDDNCLAAKKLYREGLDAFLAGDNDLALQKVQAAKEVDPECCKQDFSGRRLHIDRQSGAPANPPSVER